ncbi:MAG TPA: hypothetical protein VFX02_08660 [Gammaproteobacteria bacterium]|nr:hypothetical protein [Gammaproteobacteria bacterium]
MLKNVRILCIPLLILNLGAFDYSIAQDSNTPEALVRSIYDVHRPWDHYETRADEIRIDFYAEKVASKYFDSELAALFQKELECQKKYEGICSIDADPIFHIQDSLADSYKVQINKLKENDDSGEYEAIVQWDDSKNSKTRYVYTLRKTKKGWRVSDIESGDFSLKKPWKNPLKNSVFNISIPIIRVYSFLFPPRSRCLRERSSSYFFKASISSSILLIGAEQDVPWQM